MLCLVRVSAKELTALILDEDRLRSERSDRKLWKSRVSGIDDGIQGYGGGATPSRREKPRGDRNRRVDDDDAEYRLAIEASKHEAEEDRKRRERNVRNDVDDDDLAKAIKLSKEEEELRRRELEQSNAQSLFDDTPVPTQPQPTGYNQGYQQQPAVDWFGNPVDVQQPLTTGYLNNQYAQPTGYQNQSIGYGNGFTNGFQVQPTGFDQSQFGQSPNNFFQSQPLPQQQSGFNNNNPYGQQTFGQQPLLQTTQQQENFPPAGSHNPWALNSQQSVDALKPLPTGSNNPFASSITRPQSQPSRVGPPTLGSLAEDRVTNQFNNNISSNPIANFQTPAQSATPVQKNPTKPENPQYARLNAILASGEGQDTFGNVGNLRIPAQHTAPGTFVNSAGQGLDRLRAAQTGSNPFFSQQPTGLGHQSGWGAQINPYTQPNSQQHGGSLIDL